VLLTLTVLCKKNCVIDTYCALQKRTKMAPYWVRQNAKSDY